MKGQGIDNKLIVMLFFSILFTTAGVQIFLKLDGWIKICSKPYFPHAFVPYIRIFMEKFRKCTFLIFLHFLHSIVITIRWEMCSMFAIKLVS